MNRTKNYNLCQWEADDKIQRTDFNADNAKIDAALSAASFGNCRIAVGSYVGTGQIGEAHPNTLTFDFYPKIIFLDTHTSYAGSTALNYQILLEGLERFSDANNQCNVTWNGKTVSWYHYNTSKNPSVQFNTKGKVYHYIVLGTAEE